MALNPDQLNFFAKFIEKELGIVYTQSNFFQLERRLGDIAIQMGLATVDELWMKTQKGIEGHFKHLLLDLATNNETSFFRDIAVFKGIEQVVVPMLYSTNNILKEIRFWSAACSSGQEPYSIAMMMEQAREKKITFPTYNIFATDISDRILERAKSRTYSQLEVQRGLSAKQLVTYFENTDENSWTVKKNIPESRFQFAKVNLLDEWKLEKPFQIIFLRNVLIYQSMESKIRIVEKMTKFLEPGGFLILGAAESLQGISKDYDQIGYETAVFYQKRS